MTAPPSGRAGPDRGEDRLGYDETTTYVGGVLRRLVPRRLARRAVSVSVDTDGEVYDPGEPVEISVAFRNRLPVPVAVPTASDRLWGWRVDGLLEAADERPYVEPSPSSFHFRALETKRITRRWSGLVQSGRRFEPLAPGEHTVEAFLAVDAGAVPSDATTFRVR